MCKEIYMNDTYASDLLGAKSVPFVLLADAMPSVLGELWEFSLCMVTDWMCRNYVS